MLKSNVVKFFGNQSLVAKKLNISDVAVSKWGDTIPEKQALRLHVMTRGKLKYDPALY